MQESSDCSNDSVIVFDIATGNELSKFCGHKLPFDVISSSNKMMVVFATDRSVTANGFVISYEASSKAFGKQTRHRSVCGYV